MTFSSQSSFGPGTADPKCLLLWDRWSECWLEHRAQLGVCVFWCLVFCSCTLLAGVYARLCALFLPFYHHTHGVARGSQWKHSFLQLNKVELEFETWWDMLYCARLGGGWWVKRRMHRKYCTQNSFYGADIGLQQRWKPPLCVFFVWCWCNSLITVFLLKHFTSTLSSSAAITQSTLCLLVCYLEMWNRRRSAYITAWEWYRILAGYIEINVVKILEFTLWYNSWKNIDIWLQLGIVKTIIYRHLLDNEVRYPALYSTLCSIPWGGKKQHNIGGNSLDIYEIISVTRLV